jgi:hypothetical protein
VITFTNDRTRGAEVFPSITNPRTVPNALEMLVIHEIGFGGKITFAEKDRVVIKTQVLGCQDTSTFEGTPEEMEVLLEAAALADFFNPWRDKAVTDTLVNRILDVTQGNPLMIKLGAGMIEGQSTARKVLFGLLGDEQLIKECMDLKLSNDDLLALVSLVRIDKVDPKTALSLLN